MPYVKLKVMDSAAGDKLFKYASIFQRKFKSRDMSKTDSELSVLGHSIVNTRSITIALLKLSLPFRCKNLAAGLTRNHRRCQGRER